MDKLTEKKLQLHIDECKRRVNTINEFASSNYASNREECAKNTGILINAINAIEEYKKYKDLEEQGKLLKLPCAEGDTVYRIRYAYGLNPYIEEEEAVWLDWIFEYEEDFGKTIFLTREEAEAALKELYSTTE